MKKYTLVSIMFITLALAGAGCATTDRTTEPGVTVSPTVSPTRSPTPMTSPTGLATGATHRVADITGNPNNLIGQTVTVVADVDEVYGPRAFKLDEDSVLAGGIDNDLLILSPQARNLANIDDQWLNNKVRVTGVVRHMVVADINRELGWNLQPNLVNEYRDKPVLIASSVERVEK